MGWVGFGLSYKWVGHIITHLSIYHPFSYKLTIHYPPDPSNIVTCPFNQEWPNYSLDLQKYQNPFPNIQNYQNTPLVSKKTGSLVHSTSVWYPIDSPTVLFLRKLRIKQKEYSLLTLILHAILI